MGFMRRNHCDLFCSFVKSCACIGSWMWIKFAVCHKFALFLFCLRHWSLVDHILPVKMCGTHLGVVVSVIFVGNVNHLLRCASHTLGWTKRCASHTLGWTKGSLCLAWNGWVVTCMVSKWIVKLNCRLWPSCTWVPAYLAECIRPWLGDSNNSWQRTWQLQQPQQLQRQWENSPFLRTHRCHCRQVRLIQSRRSQMIRMLICMEKTIDPRQTRKTRRKEMLEEMMTGRDLQDWECRNHLTPMRQQTYWPLPQAWLWESRQWSLRWRVRRTSLKPLSRVRILFSKTSAVA